MKKLLFIIGFVFAFGIDALADDNVVSVGSPKNEQGLEEFTLTFVEASQEGVYKAGSSQPDVNVVINSGKDNVSQVVLTNALVFKGLTERGARIGTTSSSDCGSMKIVLKSPIYIQDLRFSAAGYSGTNVDGFKLTFNDESTTTQVTLENTTFEGSSLEFKDYYVEVPHTKKVTSITLTQTKGKSPFYVNAITFFVPKHSISNVGYATFYDSSLAYIMPENTEGYVSYYDTSFHFEKAYAAGDVVPANTALVIKGTEGDSKVIYTDELGTSPSNNDLLGTDAKTQLDEDDNSYFYALSLNASGETGSVGFYWMNETGSPFENGAHKAYLKLAKPSDPTQAAKRFLFNDEDIATSLINVKAEQENKEKYYNLDGQRVSANTKGIIVKDGKKVLNVR